MKKYRSNLFLYTLFVLLPVLLFSIYIFHTITKQEKLDRKNHALWVGTIHQKSWDRLIVETQTSLNILALSVKTNLDTPEKIQPLLKQIHDRDPRYGRLLLLDGNGKVLEGSDGMLSNENFSKLDYIREVIKTKDTVISDQQEVLEDGKKIIGFAVPVINPNNSLSAILVAQLRVDYIANIMKDLTSDSGLYVTNGNNHVIMKVNGKKTLRTDEWVKVPINHLPWNINVRIAKQDKKVITTDFLERVLPFIILTHILFLLIKYRLLKKQAVEEKKQNEAQKLELVGMLAASTAHEIRNPLTGVKGLIQLLGEKYTSAEDHYYFDVIHKELDRINEIVSEFLILGKPTIQKLEIVDISNTIEELKPIIVSEAYLYNIESVWRLPEKPVTVECVKDQIKQVILNLTKNAFESFETGGTLEVSLLPKEQTCELIITDTGKGIPAKELDKIFHPFYTSKSTGTGLGLVVCKQIILSFGGTIHVKSKEGKGTTVEITLPLKNKKA